MKRVPIRISVPLLLVLPVLIVAGVLVVVLLGHLGTTTRELVSQNTAQMHARIGERIVELVELPVRITRLNTGLVEEGRLDVADVRAWRATLFDEIQAFPDLSAIAWAGADGRATWVARYAGQDAITYAIKDELTGSRIDEFYLDERGDAAGERINHYEYDPRAQIWYRTSVDAGAPAWTKPFVWEGGDPSIEPTLGIGFGRPFHDREGRLLGVLDSELTLDDLSGFLASLDLAEGAVVIIADSAGTLLANSSSAAVARHGAPVRVADSEDQVIAALAAHLPDASRAPHDTAGVVTSIDGERWWLRAAPFAHASGLSWGIVSAVPERTFMAAIDTARARSLLVVAVAIALTVISGVVLALFMVRPLLIVEAHAKRVAEGHLEEELHLAMTPELARLSSSLNAMVVGLRDRLELRRSLELAMDVQQNLLPHSRPNVDGIDIAGHSTYCDETGGDYYDYLEVSELASRTLGIVIGDVMGHGVAAAMLMATARGILRSHWTRGGSLAALLGHLNDLLVEVTGGARFMTMLALTLDRERGAMRWVSAGHDPPFVYDPSTDAFRSLSGGDLPLGIAPGITFEEYEVRDLAPGMIVLPATDGLWEARNAAEEQFGKSRVERVVRDNRLEPAERIAEALNRALAEFLGALRPQDDVTFVVVKVTEYGG